MDVIKSSGYPKNFINNCFKNFPDNKHRVQEKVITVSKNLYFQFFLNLDHYHCKLEPS